MAVEPTVVLPSNWYRYVVADGVRVDIPGIYEWHIEGIGSYFGQYGSIKRPTRQYSRNVAHLLNGQPYRLRQADGFRGVHRALESAYRRRAQITLTILENVPSKIARNQRERELIATRGVLNASRGGRRVPD